MGKKSSNNNTFCYGINKASIQYISFTNVHIMQTCLMEYSKTFSMYQRGVKLMLYNVEFEFKSFV